MSGFEASLLLGGVHAVVLAIVLASRHRNRLANQYLAGVLVAIALLLLQGGLRAHGLFAVHPHLIGITAWVPVVLGPLVFLYVREMTAVERAHGAWRHFVVPAAYIAMMLVTFYPRSAAYKQSLAAGRESASFQVGEGALLVYGIGYAIACLVLLRRHRDRVKALYSSLRRVSLRWLLVLAALNALVWMAALVAFVLRSSGATDAAATSAIVPIGSTIVIFVIGYFQLAQVEIFDARSAEAVAPAAAPPPEPPAEPPPEAVEPVPAPPPPYARARLAEEDASMLEGRIRAAMAERHLYQRPGLTLADLAEDVGATPHEVSQILSTRLGRNFYTYINERRIEHVKARLAESDRPVLDLALEAGFQSKSTFNAAFKKATGTTPREFRERATR